MGCAKLLWKHSYGEFRKTMAGGIPGEIRTKYHPNKIQERPTVCYNKRPTACRNKEAY
jgi:hypothetical protein